MQLAVVTLLLAVHGASLAAAAPLITHASHEPAHSAPPTKAHSNLLKEGAKAVVSAVRESLAPTHEPAQAKLAEQIAEVKRQYAELGRLVNALATGHKGKIIISGNMASGKTTVSKLLAARLPGSLLILEPAKVDSLPAYYKEMDEHPDRPNKYAYDVEMEFLAVRMRGEMEAQANAHRVVVMDRCIHEDRYMYALAMVQSGIFEKKDFERYVAEYEKAAKKLEAPLTFVYLRASTPVLLKRISGRGHAFERQVPAAYLEGLNGNYEAFFGDIQKYVPGAKVIVVDTDPIPAVEVERQVWEKLAPLLAQAA